TRSRASASSRPSPAAGSHTDRGARPSSAASIRCRPTAWGVYTAPRARRSGIRPTLVRRGELVALDDGLREGTEDVTLLDRRGDRERHLLVAVRDAVDEEGVRAVR